MPTNEDLGCAIRRLRRARKLTIETLAFAAEMHPTYLGRIERGGASPTWSKVTSLARALGLSVSEVAHVAEREAEVALIVRETRAQIAAEGS
jgi:transcriptional regulator with XRE-family HTH domain